MALANAIFPHIFIPKLAKKGLGNARNVMHAMLKIEFKKCIKVSDRYVIVEKKKINKVGEN